MHQVSDQGQILKLKISQLLHYWRYLVLTRPAGSVSKTSFPRELKAALRQQQLKFTVVECMREQPGTTDYFLCFHIEVRLQLPCLFSEKVSAAERPLSPRRTLLPNNPALHTHVTINSFHPKKKPQTNKKTRKQQNTSTTQESISASSIHLFLLQNL